MTTIIFDTLDFSKRAQEAGFTKEQADFQAREAAHAIENKIASKSDIAELQYEVRTDLTRNKSDLMQEMKMMEQRLTIKMGGMVGLAVTILLAFKFFHIT
jgi:hypothetical protein